MATDLATKHDTALLLERVVVGGDLSKLTPTERMTYYAEVCKSVGLNPLTRPFQYLFLQNKMVLYCGKDGKEQLRELHGVRVTKLETRLVTDDNEEFFEATAYGVNAKGREDADIGIVALAGTRGQERANLKMRAVTKAKGRLTLSLCGLGMLDESEVEIPPTAVQTTEVVSTVESRGKDGTGVETTQRHEAQVLFPSPESDRIGLIQRARIAMARTNKQRVGKLREVWFGDQNAELEKVDLAALVSFVREVEEEKL
jgi:hypothetical protein